MLAHLDELLLQLIRDMASSGAPQAAVRLLQRSIRRYQHLMRAADMDALRPFMQQADQSTMATSPMGSRAAPGGRPRQAAG
mmetsp:Transcript_32796/g.83814  ORF Transcript_32796/g.83814 Transcript_32796/m.83814 type:complete len:81 (+) Transcript_32796:337-579(+)